MWILLILAVGPNGYGGAPSITSIPGFKHEEICKFQGNAVKVAFQTDSRINVKFTCIYQPGVNEK